MAKMSSRQMWTAKLTGKPGAGRPAATPRRAVPDGELYQKRAFCGLVLGIDPSLRGTGLALVDFQANRMPVLLRCRTVRVPAGRTLAVALAEIHRAVAEFIASGAGVRHVALERTIYVQNFQTAQILGAARGAARRAFAIARGSFPLPVSQTGHGFSDAPAPGEPPCARHCKPSACWHRRAEPRGHV